MGDVVNLDSMRPHFSGPAICLRCDYKWIQVAQVGTTEFDCPECGLQAGVMRGLILASEGEHIWECACGGTFFQWICERGLSCAKCGTIQSRYDEEPDE